MTYTLWIEEVRRILREAGCLKRVAEESDQWESFFRDGYTAKAAVREAFNL